MSLSEPTAVKRKCEGWKRRTPMEKYLIVVCILLCLVFILMIVLLALLIYLQSRPTEAICLTPLCKNEAGRIINYMDLTSDPCEDFYAFSCGNFRKTHVAPTIGLSIDEGYLISLRIRKMIKESLEAPDNGNDPEFVTKLKKFYISCLNSGPGTSKLIESIFQKTQLSWNLPKHDRVNLEKTFATIQIYGRHNPFFFFYAYDDILQVFPTIDTVVHGDVLLNTTDEKCYRKKQEYSKLLEYALYMAKVPFHLLTEEAEKIIEFETMLAQVQRNYSFEQFTDEGLNSTISEIAQECRPISFAKALSYVYDYFGKSKNFSGDNPVQLYNLDYLKEICEILKTTDDSALYSYMVWFLLSKKLSEMDEYFEMKFEDIGNRDHTLPPKWEKCIYFMTSSVYEPGTSYLALKQLQIDDALEEANVYVTEIRNQFEELLSMQSWMDVDERETAISQLRNISAKLGYSSKYLDEDLLTEYFSQINVTDDHVDNMLSTCVIATRNTFSLDAVRFTNRTDMTHPMIPNAYFFGDTIELTAAILSPPYFIPNGPKFLNYAVTGFTIGHEFTHAYAGMDAKYAAENETNRWTNETVERFIEKKRCLEDQYSKFPIGDSSTMINGTSTIHDNIADNGGLIEAFKAYEKYLKDNGNEPQLPGLPYTNQQMFFLTYAQQWCSYTKSELDMYKFDSHSPPKYRVIVPLQNSRQFSEAYGCSVGTPMNPSHKCSLFE